MHCKRCVRKELTPTGMISDPTDFPVVRKSGTYSTAPTATAKPYIRQDVNWLPAAAADANQPLPMTDWGCFVFRNPMRAAVIYKSQVPSASWAYDWVFNPVALESGEVTTAQQFNLGPNITEELWPTYAAADPANTYNPHGTRLYPGEDDGHRYIWVDGNGGTITFTTTWSIVSTIAASRKMFVYRYDGGMHRFLGAADSGAVGNTVFSYVVTPVKSGYYSIVMQNGEPVAGVGSLKVTSAAMESSWNHVTLNQWENAKASMNDIRILGVNVLVQNKSSELNKQGKVVIAQCKKNEDWFGVYGDGQVMYTNLSSNPNSKNFNWADGVYGFLKPTGETDLDWIIPFQTIGSIGTGGGSIVEDSAFPLTQSDYLGVCISATEEGSGDGVLTITHAIEWSTRSMYQAQLPPSLSIEEFEQGVQAVISMEQFYHNPIHWKKIFSTVGKIARVGAPILARFGPLGQGASEVVGAIGEALQ